MEFLRRTWAEIDLSALLHNFKVIKKKSGNAPVMAVVKADAYGHSVKDIAPLLDKAGADSFAVSNVLEAVELRDLGIKKPVLILGYTPVENADLLWKYDISQAVFSYDYAEKLSHKATAENEKIKIHLKLDTGMSRLGFDCRSNELSGLNDVIKSANLPCFECEGVFTHFAVSDRTPQEEEGFTDLQFKRFETAVEKLKENGINPEICHCSNSAATLLDDKKMQTVRPGIILYGLNPNADLKLEVELKPVMTLKSVITMVKEIAAGDTVSYGRTFKAEKPLKIATVTAGYADGYPRLLSNKGYVTVNGKKAPVVGRICMDQFLIDVSAVDGVKDGDEVVLFGSCPTADEIAKICGTINYEIVCGVTKRVPRIIIGDV